MQLMNSNLMEQRIDHVEMEEASYYCCSSFKVKVEVDSKGEVEFAMGSKEPLALSMVVVG